MKLLKSDAARKFMFILAVYMVSRVLTYTVCYFGYNLFSNYTKPSSYTSMEASGKQQMDLPASLFGTHAPNLDDFIKFDSPFYLRIAENGYNQYRMSEPHPPADWPFFPLYPMLISALHFIIPIKYSVLAFLLSNLLAVFALYFIYLIAEKVTGDRGLSEKAVIYMLIYPASIFLSVVYTESLFIFLSALTVYLLLNKKYGLSLLFAGISTIARIPGIANLFIVGFCILKEARFNPLKISIRHYIWMFLSCLPLLGFFTYMYFLTGDFLAVFHELSDNWGRSANTPFLAYPSYFFTFWFVYPGGWDLTAASFIFTTFVLAVYIVYICKYQKNYELFIYGFLLLVIPLSSATTSMTSMVRYYMASIPLFIFMSELTKKSRILDYAFTVLMLSFNVIYTIGFINDYYFVV